MALPYYGVQLNQFQCIKQRTKVNCRTPFPNGFAILRSTTDLVSVHKVENRSTISKRPCRVTECDYFVPDIKQHILEYITTTHNMSKDRSLIKKYFSEQTHISLKSNTLLQTVHVLVGPPQPEARLQDTSNMSKDVESLRFY